MLRLVLPEGQLDWVEETLLGHSPSYCQTWPAWGTWDAGEACEQATPALLTAARGSSSSPVLKTPLADNSRGLPSGGDRNFSASLADQVLQLLPTPKSRDAKDLALGVDNRNRADDVDSVPRLVRHLVEGRLLPSPTPFTNKNDESVEVWIDRRAEVEFRTGTRHGIPLPVAVQSAVEGRPLVPPLPRSSADLPEVGSLDWGAYGAAIALWEEVFGRPAPPPTADRGDGRHRLNTAFVEWMMGFPEGWVTDVPKMPPTAALKLLGNAVVPQQAALALEFLDPDGGC